MGLLGVPLQVGECPSPGGYQSLMVRVSGPAGGYVCKWGSTHDRGGTNPRWLGLVAQLGGISTSGGVLCVGGYQSKMVGVSGPAAGYIYKWGSTLTWGGTNQNWLGLGSLLGGVGVGGVP